LLLAGRFCVGRNADETGEAENIDQDFQPRGHGAPQSFNAVRAKTPPTSLFAKNVDGAVLLPLQRSPNIAAAISFRALRFFHD
jgi:hypothetical protein